MAEDARIIEIGLCAFESMEIGAANPDPPDPDNRITGFPTGFGRFFIFK
jgi:hypothetical protein